MIRIPSLSIQWYDCIEILLFSTIIYFFCVWLSKDKQKPLLFYFYSYCLLFCLSYVLNFTTITYLVFIFSPAVMMLFFMIHQHTLQKNFIALHNITPAPKPHNEFWFDDAMRSILSVLNNGKDVFLVVERRMSLNEFLEADIPIHAPLTKSFFDIVLEASIRDTTSLVWLTSHGHLIGINAHWRAELIDDAMPPKNMPHPSSFYYEHAWFTHKTDALVLHLTAQEKHATFIMHDKMVHNTSALTGLTLLREHIIRQSEQKKGDFYAYQHEKYIHRQPNT